MILKVPEDHVLLPFPLLCEASAHLMTSEELELLEVDASPEPNVCDSSEPEVTGVKAKM